nr:site-specific integrase [Halomonas massiliensis]
MTNVPADLTPQIEAFLAALSQHASPATVTAYRRDLAALSAFAETRGVVSVKQLNTTFLRAFLASERSRGLAPRSLARRRAAGLSDCTFFFF